MTHSLSLIDCVVCRMTGPEASSLLRSKNVRIPIIGVTGNVLVPDKTFFLTNGADVVLHKPLTISNLQYQINRFSTRTNDSSSACSDPLNDSGSRQELGVPWSSQITKEDVILDCEENL